MNTVPPQRCDQTGVGTTPHVASRPGRVASGPPTNKSTVDIIIPCYNTGLYLRQAIDSALAQTYPHVNILVVDDGSTDNTREIVESYGERVGYFHQENKGLPAARNIGITQTRSDFVCLLDADDVILPHMIQDQVEQFEQDDRVDVTHGKTLAFNADDIAHPCAEGRPHRDWADYVQPFSVTCAVHLGSSLIRRSCFQRFGLFTRELTEQGCEDWAFWLTCALHGAAFRYVPHVHGLYRQHPGSMSSSKLAVARRESELIKFAARMFDLCGVSETRRLKVLSCGIKSIAALWLPLGERERFLELLDLSNRVAASSVEGRQVDYSFPYSLETQPSVMYLALTKEFFDLGLPELAVFVFLKSGDIKTLQGECEQRQKSGLFEEVVASLAATVSADSVQPDYDMHEIQGISSTASDSAEFYFALERGIPHEASLHGYVKHQLGLLEESRGDMAKAEKWLRRSIPLNPNYSYTYFDLGRILLDKGDLAGAEKALRISIELNPDFSFAHYDLARCLEAQGDRPGAEEALKRSIELNPDFSFAHYDLGRLLFAKGDLESAEKELRTSIELSPDVGSAHYDLARCLEAQGDRPGAEEALKRSIELNPDFSLAHYDLGRILEARGDYFAAEQEFKSCLQLHPDFVLGRLDHAKVLAKMGKYGKAAAEFLKASRIDRRAALDYLMGWFKSLLGKGSGHDPSTRKGPF